ncbi:MAG: hypothetical protein K2X66_05295 [Cyanobacteria bacterium]|nr:hypothetical protein [Cyanobacteriota bacterium]
MAQQPFLPPPNLAQHSQQGSGMPSITPEMANRMLQSLAQNPSQIDALPLSPEQKAYIKRSLANPDADDAYKPHEFKNPLMPAGPEGFVAGGAAGVGSAYLLGKFFENAKNGDPSLLVRSARKLDGLPGVRQVSSFLENQVVARFRKGGVWPQELVTHMDPALVVKNHLDPLKQITIKELETKLLPHMKPAAFETIKKTILKANTPQELETLMPKILKAIPRIAPKASYGANKKIINELVKASQGLESSFFSLYREQHKLFKALGPEVGPIGRMYANSMYYLRQIMGGHTMHMGASATAEVAATESKGLLSRIGGFFGKNVFPHFGSFLTGGIIFGMALGEAKEAEKGDKTKAFFHNLLGVGLGQFIGWSVGKRLMRPLLNHIAPAFFKKAALGRLANILPSFLRFTRGGLVAELAAMFIISIPFQRAGEWIATKVFGKTKKVQREENAKLGIFPAKSLPSGIVQGKPSGLDRSKFGHFAEQKQLSRTSAQNSTHPLAKSADPKQNYRDVQVNDPDIELTVPLERIMKNDFLDKYAQNEQAASHMLESHHGGIHNMFDP